MSEHAPMPEAEGLIEPLRRRWSPSLFDPSHRLGPEEISLLLHAAQWSASYGNSQPWGFVVCERGSDGHRVLTQHLSRGNSGWVPRASAVFVTAAQVAAEPGEKGPKAEEYSYYDLGQAAAHLTLQAAGMGLWAHQFAGFDHDAVAAGLGVPDTYRVMSGIAVGRHADPADPPAGPDGTPDPSWEGDASREERTRRRRPLSDLAHRGAWGVPWQG